MPIPWLTVLQNVPWTDVISNAPKVAGGAKKLWDSVAGKPAGIAAPDAAGDRVAALEGQVAELHRQMLASSQLLQALAEQNTQLIQRVEVQRRWVRRLAAAVGALALLMVTLGVGLLR